MGYTILSITRIYAAPCEVSRNKKKRQQLGLLHGREVPCCCYPSSFRLLQEFKITTKTNGNLCILVTGTKDLYSKPDLGAFNVSEFSWKVGADPDCVAETCLDGQSIARWELQCPVETHTPGLLDVAFVGVEFLWVGSGIEVFRFGYSFVLPLFLLASKQRRCKRVIEKEGRRGEEELNTFLCKEDNFGTNWWHIDLEFSHDVEADFVFRVLKCGEEKPIVLIIE